jgi:hypothetical protein
VLGAEAVLIRRFFPTRLRPADVEHAEGLLRHHRFHAALFLADVLQAEPSGVRCAVKAPRKKTNVSVTIVRLPVNRISAERYPATVAYAAPGPGLCLADAAVDAARVPGAERRRRRESLPPRTMATFCRGQKYQTVNALYANPCYGSNVQLAY